MPGNFQKMNAWQNSKIDGSTYETGARAKTRLSKDQWKDKWDFIYTGIVMCAHISHMTGEGKESKEEKARPRVTCKGEFQRVWIFTGICQTLLASLL